VRLLFDENVSPELPRMLASEYPGSVHVRELGLRGAEDRQVWDYCRTQGFAIVSDLVVDAISPESPLFWRRASIFCKAPLKKWL
jgi:predicted nuclease of predicted toxin-antitoxin system